LKGYFDASVLVALFVVDSFTARARAVLQGADLTAMVSDFAAAEFTSVVARRVRERFLTESAAREAFANFDGWKARSTVRIEIERADVAFADAAMRRLDLNLRAPDAINIAITQRIGATLLTFDDKMFAAAKMLGTPVAAI
jgi:uncharacterized protein